MEIHDGNRKVTSSKYSPNIFKFCFKFRIDKNPKLKTITRPIPTNHTWPHVFSCPITLIAGKSHISIKYSRGHGAKSIKTFFLKGKAHESWNCREDQIEKKCNCTIANRTGKRIGGQTTQNGRGCTKNHNEPSEMSSKQANTGKTRVKKLHFIRLN